VPAPEPVPEPLPGPDAPLSPEQPFTDHCASVGFSFAHSALLPPLCVLDDDFEPLVVPLLLAIVIESFEVDVDDVLSFLDLVVLVSLP
jgi:hypothetical protein